MSTKVKTLTGPGLTSAFQAEATDLGISRIMPDGRMLTIFGDTFAGAGVGNGAWRSPIGLYSFAPNPTTLNQGLIWSDCVGASANFADELIPFQHNTEELSTKLPTDMIVMPDGTVYLHVMVVKGLGNTVRTEIWKSLDSGETWEETGVQITAQHYGGYLQMLTWELGGDGYVYIMGTGWRDRGVILLRAPEATLLDLATWSGWGYNNVDWDWGRPPTPILDGPDHKYGEMCLRRVQNNWVFSTFDVRNYCITVKVMSSPTANAYTAPTYKPVKGTDWLLEWMDPNNRHAQLYGGYIIPGSTLDNLHLAVSQWKTTTGWPYRVTQFKTAVNPVNPITAPANKVVELNPGDTLEVKVIGND